MPLTFILFLLSESHCAWCCENMKPELLRTGATEWCVCPGARFWMLEQWLYFFLFLNELQTRLWLCNCVRNPENDSLAIESNLCLPFHVSCLPEWQHHRAPPEGRLCTLCGLVNCSVHSGCRKAEGSWEVRSVREAFQPNIWLRIFRERNLVISRPHTTVCVLFQ